MPLPKPKKDEKEKDFVSRCVSFVMGEDEDADKDQAVAMCLQQWRDEKGEKTMDYGEEMERVRGAWQEAHPYEPVQPISDSWIRSVREDSVIAEIGQKLYEIAYSENDEGEIIFAPADEWVEVERVAEYAPAKGNALKALRETDDELIVGNYIVLFGGRDLEGLASPHVNPDGSKGEYFTAKTVLKSAYTDTGRLLVDWEHGVGYEGEPEGDDVLGYVDWSTAKADANGLWVERVLKRRNEYMRFLGELIKAGLIGTSSEAVDSGIERKANGEITSWPLKRDALTVTPMEPRMLTDNLLQAIKALSGASPMFKALLSEPEPDKGRGSAGALRQRKAKVRVRLALFKQKSMALGGENPAACGGGETASS